MLQRFLPDSANRVVVYLEPISMRWGTDRIRRFCQDELGVEPDPGTAFLFLNSKRDTLLLYFVDGEGDQLLMKKLDRGSFLLPAPDDDASFVTMKPSMLPRLFRT